MTIAPARRDDSGRGCRGGPRILVRVSPPARRDPPAWLRRWEGLHVAAQVGVMLPLAILALWAVHIALLNQPVGRGLAYGVFWGAIATALVVGASRSERARRGR